MVVSYSFGEVDGEPASCHCWRARARGRRPREIGAAAIADDREGCESADLYHRRRGWVGTEARMKTEEGTGVRSSKARAGLVRRPFRVLDAMILVAATAAGC